MDVAELFDLEAWGIVLAEHEILEHDYLQSQLLVAYD